MILLATYLALALAGNAVVYFVVLAVEQMWPVASLPVFLILFFAVLWGAWLVAVKITAPKGEQPA